MTFAMAGGGTGGHVMPALAVARELKQRGHEVFFFGTRAGLEARLVPEAGFEIEWIEIGGLKRVGLARTLRTLAELPLGSLRSAAVLKSRRAAALFSMGGFVAGPPTLAARLRGLPIVLMEPNAMPGFTARRSGWMISRALLNFEAAARYFPAGKTEVTGLPVREAFFHLPPKPRGAALNILITGGSQGSRTLNNAVRASWPLFQRAGFAARWLHQTGTSTHEELARDFAATGLEGEVVPFIKDMPRAFEQADLVVCRSGAGAVAELAAAGKPSILCPFPFAADDHQRHNALAMVERGAALLVEDRDMTGERLFREALRLWNEPGALENMGRAARRLARPGAAARAADWLEALARGTAPRNSTIESPPRPGT